MTENLLKGVDLDAVKEAIDFSFFHSNDHELLNDFFIAAKIAFEELDSAHKRIAELETASEWQPIETVPAIGTFEFIKASDLPVKIHTHKISGFGSSEVEVYTSSHRGNLAVTNALMKELYTHWRYATPLPKESK